MNIIEEALLALRSHYVWWLSMLLTTDAEKELAKLKIAMIDEALT